MTAGVNGQSWTSSDFARQAQVGNFGLISLQGSQNGTTIILSLYNIDQIGAYDLGMGGTNVGGSAQISDLTGKAWSTPLSGAAGTVTITTLTPTRIAGTFSFDADAFFGGATGTKTVTQGQFDMILASGNNTWPLPDESGNRLDGMIDGSLWKASTVVIQISGSAIVIAANNTSYSIGMSTTQFAGVGSYPIGTQPGNAVVNMLGPAANPTGPVNCCWGTIVGDVGTLTITSLTATRIQGTLTATLAPVASSAATGNLDISNLTVDIGRP